MSLNNYKRTRTEMGEIEIGSISDEELLLQTMTKRGEDYSNNEARQKEERARKRRLRQQRMMNELKYYDREISLGRNQPKDKNKEDSISSTAGRGFEKPPPSYTTSLATTTAIEEENDVGNNNLDEDVDFDMFSSSVSPPKKDGKGNSVKGIKKIDDFQDAEGYYKATIGEILELDSSPVQDNSKKKKFKVLGVVGKGVFSTVLKCCMEEDSGDFKSLNKSKDNPTKKDEDVVALKLIRNNDTMSRAAETEVAILHRLQPHRHIVALLSGKSITKSEDDTGKADNSLRKKPPPLQHYVGHVVVMFPYLPYNVRDVLAKFGKGVGLSLAAVQSYLSQLLSALAHLSRHNIIHADLKPDNLLVSEDFSTVKVCDFGSAMLCGSAQALPTPYLVSRFYRAPEVILGFPPRPTLDLWSVGVTAIELFTGHVLFPGANNNNMVHQHLFFAGSPSNKVIRQHLLQVLKLGIPSHFAKTECKHFVYLQQKQQSSGGQNIVQHIGLTEFPTKSLFHLLLRSKSPKESRLQVQDFFHLLQHILTWDPLKRIPILKAQTHKFFSEDNNSKEK